MMGKPRANHTERAKYDIRLIQGNAIKGLKEIPDHSVDLIFTDPPYTKKSIYLYSVLAQEAKRILKPGHYLFCYSGNYFLNDTLRRLEEHLSFFWVLAIKHNGCCPMHYDRKMVNMWKPVLVFTNGKPKYKCGLIDLYLKSKPSKEFHQWGQSLQFPLWIIRKFTPENALVVDPFLGGGTTAQACKILHRKFIGFELDPVSFNISVNRLSDPLLTDY